MQQNASGLKSLLPDLPMILSSPYVRARQTADAVQQAYPEQQKRLHTDTIVPGGDPQSFQNWWSKQDEMDSSPTAVISHNPFLERLVPWLITGQKKRALRMKQGGVAFLLLNISEPQANSGKLHWHLPPDQLRAQTPSSQ